MPPISVVTVVVVIVVVIVVVVVAPVLQVPLLLVSINDVVERKRRRNHVRHVVASVVGVVVWSEIELLLVEDSVTHARISKEIVSKLTLQLLINGIMLPSRHMMQECTILTKAIMCCVFFCG